MSDVPDGLRYTTEHEYLKEADELDVFYIGITDYAQGELGDVVYVELPEPGDTFAPMETFGTIEAVKAPSTTIPGSSTPIPTGKAGWSSCASRTPPSWMA